MKAEDRERLRHDLLASVVVFLVALPLCMGVAIASGVPPAAGLISGVVGGIVVGALAGSPLQVSGPAAGLAVMVLDVVTRFGLEALAPILCGAAALQLLAGGLRQGRAFRAVSPGVLQGMLAGIGVLIVIAQSYVLLDLKPPGGGRQSLLGFGGALEQLLRGPAAHRQAGLVGLVTLGVLSGWSFLPKRAQAVPGPLVAVIVASVVARFAAPDVAFVRVPQQLLGELKPISLDSLALLGAQGPLLACLALAVIASAETLLCTGATDQLHDGPRADYDRELLAQGAGNMLCGLLGALPVAGVIVRSTANIQSGGRTRASTILHGVWLLVFVVVFPRLLGLIPVACLAGVLVFTGLKLAHPKHARAVATYGRGELAVFGVTLVTIVVSDLLTGIMVGVGLAFVRLVRAAARLYVRSEVLASGERCVRLSGAATFVALPKLAQALESIPGEAPVHVHTADLSYIDSACLELLQAFERRHQQRGTHVYVEDWERLWATYHGAPEPPVASCPGLSLEAASPASDPQLGAVRAPDPEATDG